MTVAGRADLEAKIGELRALMEGRRRHARCERGCAPPAEVNGAAAPAAADGPPSTRPAPLQGRGCTIWLNKKNPRNSYGEYLDKKEGATRNAHPPLRAASC